ncbi:hypothetical protein GWK47_010858 [Chionoecetes opilio]|uniref:Uncharacterized protein n=1 Tax=Chionoecetes opilio TaxID=41210 RepID=A0A8J5CMS2_CHIOP|nr:hypothetical protein GWK47_010858 [Chionoecetes opilio]
MCRETAVLLCCAFDLAEPVTSHIPLSFLAQHYHPLSPHALNFHLTLQLHLPLPEGGRQIYGRGMATGEVPNIVIPGESSSVERRGSPGVFVPPKIQKEVLFAAESFYRCEGLGSVATYEYSDVGCVVGEEEILKLYEEYGALAKSKSRKDRDERNKRCIFKRQPQRHLTSRFPRHRSEDPRGRQGVLGGSEGGPAELSKGWRGTKAKGATEEKAT